MAQWIQKPGGNKINIADTSYDSLQDAANAGYSPVSAPTPTPTPTPAPATAPTTPTPSSSSDTSTWGINPANQAPTPASTPTAQPPTGATYISDPAELGELSESQIWRDPNTNKIYKLPTTATPTQPTPAPEITADVFKDEEDLTIENDEKLTLIKSINDSFIINPNLSANPAFIHGVAKLAGREATPDDLAMAGQSISRIAEHFGITGMLDNYGMAETVKEVGKSKEDTIKDLQAKAESGVKLNPADEANWEYATGNKDYPVAGAQAPAFGEAGTATQAPTTPETGGNAVSNMYDELIAEKQEGMLEGVDMTDFMAKKNEANLAVETARQAIADKQLIDAVELENIADQPISMTAISRQQHKYSGDEYITNLKMAQDYNNKLILAKMAEGNFLEAQRINKDIANDNYEINKLQLDQLMYNDKIKADEHDRMQRELDWERKLAIEYGYTHIPDIDTYNAIVKQYKITPANFDSFIYKEGDKMYLKSQEKEMSELELYEAKKQIDARYKTSGTGGAGVIKDFKFSTSQRTGLIGAGISNDEMAIIETDLAGGWGLEEIFENSNFSDSEKETIRREFTGEKKEVETPEFLTEDYIKREFEEGLKEEYPLKTFDTLGYQSKAKKEKLQQEAIDKAIKEILEQVKELRATGLTDKEIDKML